jgi:hypothetical protein
VPLRILNWNIRNLSASKIVIPGMSTAIARTIVGLNPDIVILLEVHSFKVGFVMQRLVTELNSIAGGTKYTTCQLSHVTGSEYYAFIVRDTATVRPMRCAANPNFPPPAMAPPLGTSDNPVRNLEATCWTTWPNNTWNGAVPPNQAPDAPLVNTFVDEGDLDRSGKRRREDFAGRSVADGGYALGRGFRLPCLAIFHQHTAAGDSYFPIVVCHYAAIRSGRNMLAQSQVGQLPYLHIAQLFSWVDQQNPAPAVRGYLDLDGVAQTVQEIVFTGDFNIDFLQNDANGDGLQQTNRTALGALTPTGQQGGSVFPLAAPGKDPTPPAPVPDVPFAELSLAPDVDSIGPQSLRAAVTRQKTIFRRYPPLPRPPPPPPASSADTRSAAFDNFFYGGTRAANAAATFGSPPPPGSLDSGDVVDLTANIVRPGRRVGRPPLIDVSAVAWYYGGVHAADRAPSLQVPGRQPLTLTDTWIGANLVSDHVPMTLDIPDPP